MGIVSDPIGQKTFTVPVLDKATNTIIDKTYTDPTSLNQGKYLLGVLTARVIDVLIAMITTMQIVAVQQSNKLTFFSKLQNANTGQMNSVHTFTLDNQDPKYISGEGTTQNTDRQALNQTNSTYVQEIQANNNLISNTAKQIQTNVNQTQQSVEQESNMMTSLIQELQTISTAVNNAK